MEVIKIRTISSYRKLRARSIRALIQDVKHLSWRLKIRNDLGNVMIVGLFEDIFRICNCEFKMN